MEQLILWNLVTNEARIIPVYCAELLEHEGIRREKQPV